VERHSAERERRACACLSLSLSLRASLCCFICLCGGVTSLASARRLAA
jgi:hypothetical protein